MATATMTVTRGRREPFLWAVFAALVVGAVFFGTRPMRRAAFLRQASLAELETQVKRSPDDTALLEQLGEKQRAAGHPSEAYTAFAHAAELAPHNFRVWEASADLAETLNGRQGAFDLLSVYVRNNPQDGNGYLALARLYYNSQSHVRAETMAQQAVKLDPKLAEAWRIVAWEAVKRNALSEAEAGMRKAIEAAPSDYRNLVGMGDVQTASARFADAERFYRQAQTLAPDEPNVQIMLARALLRAHPDGDAVMGEAESLARKSLAKDDGRAITHLVLGEIFERKKQPLLAVQEYQVAALLSPGYPDTSFHLAKVYKGMKNATEAQRWYTVHDKLQAFSYTEKILVNGLQEARDAGEKRQKAVQLARQSADAGLLQDAVQRYGELVRQQPDPAVSVEIQRLTATPEYREQSLAALPTETLLAQGNQFMAQGRMKEALPLYFLAVRRNRYHAVALQNVGLCLQAEGKTADAVPFLVDALKNDAGLSRAHFVLGDVAQSYKMWTEARQHYEKGLAREDGNAEAWFRLGVIDREAQKEADSYAAFEKAYRLKPTDARYAREWADSLDEQGKAAEAETILRQALSTESNDGETLAQLGALCLKQPEKVSESVTLLKRAVAIDPSDDVARYGLAQAVLKQGQSKDAKALLEGLVRRSPTAREIWFTLGQACRGMGDGAGAKRALDQARILEQRFLLGKTIAAQVAGHPNDDALRVQLARLQAESGDDVGALTNWEQAIRHRPDRADWARERDALRKRLAASGKAVDMPLLSLIHDSTS